MVVSLLYQSIYVYQSKWNWGSSDGGFSLDRVTPSCDAVFLISGFGFAFYNERCDRGYLN